MVSVHVVDTPKEPVIGAIGKSSIPEVMQLLGRDSVFLQHKPTITADSLDRMFKTDGEVSGLYRLVTTPLKKAELRVHPKHNKAKREANDVHDMLTSSPEEGGMLTPITQVVSTALRMLVDGWAGHEIVWNIRNQKVVVDKVAYLPSNTVTVEIDKNSNIMRYNQKPLDFSFGKNIQMAESDINIWAKDRKIMHFVFGNEWNPVYGRSMFLQSYYHFEKKHKLYYIAHMAAQIRALRLRILRAPQDENIDKLNAVVEVVSKLGFNSTMSLPDGYELEFPDIGGETVDVLPMIQHHDTQMAKSVLAQVMDVGTEGKTGSFNLSDTHFDIFITNLGLIGNYIASVINTYLIPPFIDWNYGTGNYPKVEFLPFDRDVRREMAALFTRLVGAKSLNVSPEFMIEMEKIVAEAQGLDIDFEAVEKRMKDKIERDLQREVKLLEDALAQPAVQPEGNEPPNNNGNDGNSGEN